MTLQEFIDFFQHLQDQNPDTDLLSVFYSEIGNTLEECHERDLQ